MGANDEETVRSEVNEAFVIHIFLIDGLRKTSISFHSFFEVKFWQSRIFVTRFYSHKWRECAKERREKTKEGRWKFSCCTSKRMIQRHHSEQEVGLHRK
jgi:hypothetical protein